MRPRFNNGWDIPVSPGPFIWLDFGSGIDRSFIIQTDPSTNRQTVATLRGSHPAAPLGLPVNQIQQRVQGIFDNSGITTQVVLNDPGIDAVRIRFGSPLGPIDFDGDGTADGTLGGRAYDTLPKGQYREPVDRFDVRKDAQVALFVDPADPSFSLDVLVESIAHEAGHTFGASHIDPSVGAPNAVLDYDPSASPKFFDKVTPIVAFQPDGNGTFTSQPTKDTHNPSYHIRRYAVGEAPQILSSEAGLEAGSYDEEGFSLLRLRFTIPFLNDRILGLNFVTGEPEARDFGPNLGEGLFSDSILSEAIQGDSFELILDGEHEFKILASSSDPSISDIAFGFGASGSIGTELRPSELDGREGSIFKWNEGSNSYEAIGNFRAELVETLHVLPVSEVPEPSGAVIIATLFLAQLSLGRVVVRKYVPMVNIPTSP